MRRHLLAFAAALAITPLAAQVRFGAKAGLNLAHVTSNDPDVNNNKDIRATLHGGLVADFGITDNFSFQPHLLLQGKGTSLNDNSESGTVRFVSLDLPLNVLYRSDGGFFIGGGPNLGFNLNASTKSAGVITDLPIGSGSDEVKGFDFGINLMTGYQSKGGFLFGVNYLWGLTNLDNSAGALWKNHVFGISVGYLFGGSNDGGK